MKSFNIIGINELINKFDNIEKNQILYAEILSTDDLAFSIKNRQNIETLANLAFKRKLPNVIKIIKATKSNPFAEIYMDKSNWGYFALKQHYLGGDRHNKGLEKFLKSKNLLKDNEILIQTPGTKKSLSKKIMQELNSKSKQFFIIDSNISIKKAGIYTKINDYDKPILLFKIVKNATYKKVLDLETTAKKEFTLNGMKYFKDRLEYAIKTAK